MVGGLCEPTQTAGIDLASILQSATSRYSELSGLPLSWYNPTVNGTSGALQYSVPRVSNFCYLTPDAGTIRYDVYPLTQEYTLTWYLYANRFPGYKGDVHYVVKLLNPLNSTYDFSVSGSDEAAPMHFTPDAAEPATWNLTAPRASFDGTDRALMLSVDGGAGVETGLTLNGREPQDTVVLEVQQKSCALNVRVGEGVDSYAFVTPAIASGDLVRPGTLITLSVTPKDGYRNVEVVSKPKGLAFARLDDRIVFTMPSYDVTVTLVAYPVYTIEYMYNYGDMGVYKTVEVASNEAVAKPAAPAIRGMTFRGWYKKASCSGDPYEFGGEISKDLKLYADWTCNVTVDFGAVQGQAAYQGDNEQPVMIFDGDYGEYYRFTYSTLRVGDKLLDIVLPNYSATTSWAGT